MRKQQLSSEDSSCVLGAADWNQEENNQLFSLENKLLFFGR